MITVLRDTGLLNNTVLLFTSDHGDLAMEHRQFYKMSMFEGSSHVPLLMMGPGIKSGTEISLPVSLVDLYPSMLGKYNELLMVSRFVTATGQLFDQIFNSKYKYRVLKIHCNVRLVILYITSSLDYISQSLILHMLSSLPCKGPVCLQVFFSNQYDLNFPVI